MTQVVITERAVSNLGHVAADISSTLLKMMSAGIITRYHIIRGDEVIAAVEMVPPDEPLVIVVADSIAVGELEKALLPLRDTKKTDIIRVRSADSLTASVALTAMQGSVVTPDEFWEILNRVINKYHVSVSREEVQDAVPQEAVRQPVQEEQPSAITDRRPEETQLAVQPEETAEEKPRPVGLLARLSAAMKKERGEQKREENVETRVEVPKRDREEHTTRETGKERIVPIKCAKVGISGVTVREFEKISQSIDRIYQGAVTVGRVSLSTISTAVFPVIVVVNGRNIDDPQIARASMVIVLEEDTELSQLTALPNNMCSVIVKRKGLVQAAVKAICAFAEGKDARCN